MAQTNGEWHSETTTKIYDGGIKIITRKYIGEFLCETIVIRRFSNGKSITIVNNVHLGPQVEGQ